MVITYSWLRGFFEGDGGLVYNVGGIYCLYFTQKNPEIPYKLKEFFGYGSVYKMGNGAYKLRITKRKFIDEIMDKMNHAEKNDEYIIGLIEAEGCFSTRNNSSLVFGIGMCNKEIIQYVKDFFGFGYVRVNHRISKINSNWNNITYIYHTKRINDCYMFSKILDSNKFISSHKRRQFEIWKEAAFNKKNKIKYNYELLKTQLREIKNEQYLEV